jgi:hypothetical protein
MPLRVAHAPLSEPQQAHRARETMALWSGYLGVLFYGAAKPRCERAASDCTHMADRSSIHPRLRIP